MGTNPFLRVRDSSQKATFWASAALTIATMTALLVLGAPLRTSEAPWGIVSFELAGHLANSEMILASWDPTAKVSAGANLGLDYLFIVAYTVAIGLGCVLVAGGLAHNGRQWGHAGIFLSWGTILAGARFCRELRPHQTTFGLQSRDLAGRREVLRNPEVRSRLPCSLLCHRWRFGMAGAGQRPQERCLTTR